MELNRWIIVVSALPTHDKTPLLIDMADRLLFVTVAEAFDLPKGQWFGKTDPYCKVCDFRAKKSPGAVAGGPKDDGRAGITKIAVDNPEHPGKSAMVVVVVVGWLFL